MDVGAAVFVLIFGALVAVPIAHGISAYIKSKKKETAQ